MDSAEFRQRSNVEVPLYEEDREAIRQEMKWSTIFGLGIAAVLAWLIIWPIIQSPVADKWVLYLEATRYFIFPGFLLVIVFLRHRQLEKGSARFSTLPKKRRLARMKEIMGDDAEAAIKLQEEKDKEFYSS